MVAYSDKGEICKLKGPDSIPGCGFLCLLQETLLVTVMNFNNSSKNLKFCKPLENGMVRLRMGNLRPATIYFLA